MWQLKGLLWIVRKLKFMIILDFDGNCKILLKWIGNGFLSRKFSAYCCNVGKFIDIAKKFMAEIMGFFQGKF
jgi:hypothetical protein